MNHHTKYRRTIVVYLTAEDIYQITGMEPSTRIVVDNVRADGDRGVIIELVETAQVLVDKRAQNSADAIGAWLESRTDKGENGQWSRADRLYKDFAEWCRSSGHAQMSSTKFGQRLLGRGFEKKKSNGMHYRLSLTCKQKGSE